MIRRLCRSKHWYCFEMLGAYFCADNVYFAACAVLSAGIVFEYPHAPIALRNRIASISRVWAVIRSTPRANQPRFTRLLAPSRAPVTFRAAIHRVAHPDAFDRLLAAFRAPISRLCHRARQPHSNQPRFARLLAPSRASAAFCTVARSVARPSRVSHVCSLHRTHLPRFARLLVPSCPPAAVTSLLAPLRASTVFCAATRSVARQSPFTRLLYRAHQPHSNQPCASSSTSTVLQSASRFLGDLLIQSC